MTKKLRGLCFLSDHSIDRPTGQRKYLFHNAGEGGQEFGGRWQRVGWQLKDTRLDEVRRQLSAMLMQQLLGQL